MYFLLLKHKGSATAQIRGFGYITWYLLASYSLFIAQLQWNANERETKKNQTQMSRETNDWDKFDHDTIAQDVHILVPHACCMQTWVAQLTCCYLSSSTVPGR